MDTGEIPTMSTTTDSPSRLSFLPNVNLANIVPQPFRDWHQALNDWRDRLGLLNPGTAEGIHKEVQRDVFMTNYAFSGMKAELGRSFSANPLFQVQHAFSAGSSQAAPWSFLGMYATDNVFFQGNLDNDLQLMARCHVALDSRNVTKIMTQTSPSQPGGVFTLEHDTQLASTSLNFKTMNPDFTSQAFQGVVVGSILQSITPRLSLGLESAWQRQAMGGLGGPPGSVLPSETSTSFLARLCGQQKDWIAAATFVPSNGALTATYWKRLGEKVEAGVALDVKAGSTAAVPQGGGLMAQPVIQRVREGTATVGLKYEFRSGMYRAQIDSGGRVSAYYDKRISPQIGLSFCGDIDHVKGVAKFGVGVTIEASDIPDDFGSNLPYQETHAYPEKDPNIP